MWLHLDMFFIPSSTKPSVVVEEREYELQFTVLSKRHRAKKKVEEFLGVHVDYVYFIDFLHYNNIFRIYLKCER